MKFIQIDSSYNPRLFEIARTIAEEFVPFQQQTLIAFCLGKKSRILSIGINSFEKTHSKQIKFARVSENKSRIYIHAEIDALIRVRGVAKSILVVRFGKNMDIRSAKPCEICELAIRHAGIKKIYYT